MQTERQITFFGLTVKTIVAHTVTYFIMGLMALAFLDYRTAFEGPVTREYMRSVDDPIIALGPSLQFIRGILFAEVFYLLRDILFGRKNGWLIMWVMLVSLGILSTFAAAPSYSLAHKLLVVSPEGQLAAYSLFWLYPANKTAEIDPIGTHPNHRNRGLARALVLESFKRMRESGMEYAYIASETDDPVVSHLYASLQPVEAYQNSKWTK